VGKSKDAIVKETAPMLKDPQAPNEHAALDEGEKNEPAKDANAATTATTCVLRAPARAHSKGSFRFSHTLARLP
jgi:hypothetical protein